MRKYWTVFKISWQRELEYRVDFFMGRLGNIVVLLVLYFVWTSLSSKSGKFAGYTGSELATYVFLVNIIRQVIFGSKSRMAAMEINEGIFSKYLTMPINHFWFIFSREMSQRSINLLAAIIEVIVFAFFLKSVFILNFDFTILILFLISVLLAVFLYSIMSYCMSLFAFWSREAMGPRFLFEWFLEFASGAYFPLSIFSGFFYSLLIFLPFAYLIYFPVSVYLVRLEFWQILAGITIQILFIIIFGFLTGMVWKKGLKRYSGEGI